MNGVEPVFFEVTFGWSDGSATTHRYVALSFEDALGDARRDDRHQRNKLTLVDIQIRNLEAYREHKTRM